MSKIIELINRQAYPKALEEINSQIKKYPNSIELYKAAAMVYMFQNDNKSAMSTLQKANSIKSNDYDINVNLSYLFNQNQDYKAAIEHSEIALKIDQNKPEPYHNLAHSYLYVPNLEEAERNVLQSIKLRGGLDSDEILKFPDTINLYADILQSKGDLDLLNDFSIKMLDKNKFLGDMFRRVLRNNKKAITENHLNTIHRSIKELEKNKVLIKRNLSKASAYFCLAEYYQKSDNEKSENYYVQANKLIIDTHVSSIYGNQKFIKDTIKFSDKINSNSVSNIPYNKGNGLIFIIGMPRSGTTLLESIVSTANDCIAGGEKLFFPLECKNIIRESRTSDIENNFFENLGNKYLDIIEIQRKENKFYIDKLPDNYCYYKLIRTSLPGAKFLHIHRDPWDNAISIFKQNFQKDLFWASSFFGIALQYANYEHLMRLWKEEKNNDIFDINYAELVSDTKESIKKIWSFCGLEGEYNESRRQKHFAQTASKHQITQKIYSTSLKKLEFEKFKDDFLKDLELQRQFWRSSK